jgi:hypothetical protein
MPPHIDNSKVEVYYGETRLNPAPLISYQQQSQRTEAGDRVSDIVSLTLNGVVLNLSDLASGDFSQLNTRREDLINAVSGDRRELRIVHGANGSAPSGTAIITGVFPKVESLSFEEGIWVSQIPYSLQLTYETNLASGATPVSNYSDSWSFEEDADKRVIRLQHSVQAQGIDTSTSGDASTALNNARTWVLARMGVNNVPSGYPSFADSGTLGAIKYQKYRTENVDIAQGSYSADEEIIMASGAYANNYTVQYQKNEEGIVVVTINGNIEGLGRFDNALTNAMSGWNNHVQYALSGIAYDVYNAFSGVATLNVDKQQSFSVSRDPFAGTVGYSVSYNDDPADDVPSGIAEIQITKQIQLPIEKTAQFEIPGRARGPIFHRVGTSTEGQITINGTVQGEIDTQLTYVKQVAEDEVNALRPNAANYNDIRITSKSITENEKQKSVSFSLVWGYADNLSSVQSPSGEVTF